jgi:hypothetical protein
MIDRFIAWAEVAWAEVAGWAPCPVSSDHIIFIEDSITLHQPHEDLDSARNLSLPYVSKGLSSIGGSRLLIYRFGRKAPNFAQFPGAHILRVVKIVRISFIYQQVRNQKE